MSNTNIDVEDAPAAPAIQPETLAQLKKANIKQAILERFKDSVEAPAARTAVRRRSPYWQPADEEC